QGGNIGIETTGAGDIILSLASGNVGIGTTNPLRLLHLESNIPSPKMFLKDTGNALNEKSWTAGLNGGTYQITTRTDADGAGEVGMSMTRTGTAIDEIQFPKGDVRIDGDLFFKTDGSGLPYASCYGNDIAWTQAAAINVVYNVSDADMVTGQLNLATHDGNGKLTVAKAGRYYCHYTATIKSSIAGKHIISGFEISGSGNMEPDGRNHIDLVGANNQLECSGNAILDLAANATIEMAISSSDAGNPTVTVEHLNITCFQIGGT
ncbi:hypothetical protein LCGC14_1143060, partial [marine sediment metagenome]